MTMKSTRASARAWIALSELHQGCRRAIPRMLARAVTASSSFGRAFGRSEAQLFHQQSEVNAVFCGGLNAAAGGRVKQRCFRTGQLGGSQGVKRLHSSILARLSRHASPVQECLLPPEISVEGRGARVNSPVGDRAIRTEVRLGAVGIVFRYFQDLRELAHVEFPHRGQGGRLDRACRP